MRFALNLHRKSEDTSESARQRREAATAALVILGLIGAAGCGGGGGNGGGSSSAPHPSALSLGTPTSVTGSAVNGLTLTFSETLTTISGSPAVTFALHEVNNGSAPVTVSAAQDPTTQDLFPVIAVQALDPQGRPLSLPPVTGSQTLTLAPGDTADTSQTFSVGVFPQPGRYTITVSSTGTQGVPALAGGIVLTAS